MLHIDSSNHNFEKHVEKINEIINTLGNMIEKPPVQKRKIGFNVE